MFYYLCIRFANSELNAAKEKLVIPAGDLPQGENCQRCDFAAPLKTAKEPVEKHRLEPYLILRKENFLIQYRNLEKALKYGLFLLHLTFKRIYAILEASELLKNR